MSGNTSGCSTFARGSGINVSRYRGTIIELLVASLLAMANRHCVLVRLFSFRGREASPRPGRRSITPRLAAWACQNPASQSRHLRFSQLPRTRVSLPHAKWRARTNHSSHFDTVPPAPLAGLVSFASAPFADALCLADSAGCFRSFRQPQTAETGTDSGAPKDDNGGRDAPHIGQNQNYGREASPGQEISIMGAMLRMSPRTPT